MENLGSYLAFKRNERDISQKDMAVHCNVSASHISRLENESRGTEELLKKILKRLDLEKLDLSKFRFTKTEPHVKKTTQPSRKRQLREEDFRATPGYLIYSNRKRKKMSRIELALAVGTTSDRVYHDEKNIITDPAQIAAYARTLGFSVADYNNYQPS